MTLETGNFILKTGDILEIIYDDPSLKGTSTQAILLGIGGRDCFAVLTNESTIAYIDMTNIKNHLGSTLDSLKTAVALINNWLGSVPPKVI